MKKKSTEGFLFHETNYNTSLPALQTLSKQVRSTVLFFLTNLTKSVNLEAATPKAHHHNNQMHHLHDSDMLTFCKFWLFVCAFFACVKWFIQKDFRLHNFSTECPAAFQLGDVSCSC